MIAIFCQAVQFCGPHLPPMLISECHLSTESIVSVSWTLTKTRPAQRCTQIKSQLISTFVRCITNHKKCAIVHSTNIKDNVFIRKQQELYKFPKQKIMAAQYFNSAPKFHENEEFSTTKLYFKRLFSNEINFQQAKT